MGGLVEAPRNYAHLVPRIPGVSVQDFKRMQVADWGTSRLAVLINYVILTKCQVYIVQPRNNQVSASAVRLASLKGVKELFPIPPTVIRPGLGACNRCDRCL